MHGAAKDPDDFHVLMKRLFRFEQGWETWSPLRQFACLVRDPSLAEPDDAHGRLREALAALRLLDCPELDTPTLRELVADLPAPPVEIALVWAAVSEERERAPGAAESAAAQLILAELCVICCRGARTLRGWGLLPEHRDDSEGVVWASDVFCRIVDGCECAALGAPKCARPGLHLLTSWLLGSTHARQGNSRYFALRSWLERACFGYSPAFDKVGAFSQGLVATIRPRLVVGEAAVRRCLRPQCSGEKEPPTVAKGRPCPRCREEPGSAIRFVRKIIDYQLWALERFERCGSGTDEHFMTFAEIACPECGWPSRRDRSDGDLELCSCGTRFPAEEALCPVCRTRVARREGILRGWVHRPPPTMRPFDPSDPRFQDGSRLGGDDRQVGWGRPSPHIGLSSEVAELLNRLRVDGGMRERRVREFVMQVRLISREGRDWMGLEGEPSLSHVIDAQMALDRLCMRVRTGSEELLLRKELDRLVSDWHDQR